MMNNPATGYVVSAREYDIGGVVYFDGVGAWTTKLEQAHVARSTVGRKALLHVASALINDNSVRTPGLAEVEIQRDGRLADQRLRRCV